jgi:hypothetical protein
LRGGVIASVVVHSLLLLGAARGAVGSPPAAAPPPEAAEPPLSDVWAGDTSLPGRGGLYDVDVDRATAAPGATQTEAEAQPPQPTPAATATATAKVTAEPRPARAPKEPGPANAHSAGSPPGAPRAATGADRRDGESPGGGSFGAVDKPGIRDLGRAFTRAMPLASQSDAAWGRLPVGNAGMIDVTIDVDSDGKIAGYLPSERNPPRHLVQMVERTLALLEAGTFALKGQVGKGSERLELSATVTEEAAALDVTPGDALAFEFDGKKGKASFFHKSGRRVEIRVRVVHVGVARAVLAE